MDATKIAELLRALLPGGAAEENVKAAEEMDARAQEAGLATKAVDAEAGVKALAAVEELKAKLGEAHILIAKQAETIANLQGRLEGVENGQKAYQTRGETAIREVKELLVTLNAKPELTNPEEQAKLAAIEAATKAKIESATNPATASAFGPLVRYTYTPDGKAVATPIV